MALETGEKFSDQNPVFTESGRMDGETTLGGDEAPERSVSLNYAKPRLSCSGAFFRFFFFFFFCGS